MFSHSLRTGSPREGSSVGVALPSQAKSQMQASTSLAGQYRIVNFGCGPSPTTGCINVDGSPTVLLAKLPIPASLFGARKDFVREVRAHKVMYCLARNLHFPESSLDAFYSSHTLEHLSRTDCERLLGRVRGWLKPLGLLRVVLPDLRRMAAAYIANEIDASEFVARTRLAQSDLPWWSVVLGHAHHRYMYDVESLGAMLHSLGYQTVEEAACGRSRMPLLGTLDLQSREPESFYLEATK